MSKNKFDDALVEKIIDAIDGKGTENQSVSEDVFYDNLPEGHTRDTEKERQEYVSTYIGSAAKAVGRVAVETMAKDKKIETVSSTVGLGVAGQADFKTLRSKTTTAPGKSDEIIIKGSTRSDVTFIAGKNAGLLKKALLEVRDYAEEKLK